jgi:hypothetical protein
LASTRARDSITRNRHFPAAQAEAGQPDFVAILQMSGGHRHQITQDRFSLLFREVTPLGQLGGSAEYDASPARTSEPGS